MSNITIDMIGIFHRSLYFDMLNGNLKNYKNILSFFSTFLFQHCDFFYDCLYSTFMFSLELFKAFELILSYYSMVLINCLYPLLYKFLLHKPKLLPYDVVGIFSSCLLLHANMVVIQI
jgi:hypothetical protein